MVQTMGLGIWGGFFLFFWLGFQKTKYCSNEIPTWLGVLWGIAIHGLFPPVAMSWLNMLRDVCTGSRHYGKHRLRGGREFLLLIIYLVFSPLLLVGLGMLGIVRLCRSCCKKKDLEPQSVDSGTELTSVNTHLLSKADPANMQSEEQGWDAETVVDSKSSSTMV